MRPAAAGHAPAWSPCSARPGAASSGWYPGDWIWPALLALVVAVVAGVVSAVWLADELELGQRDRRPHTGRPPTSLQDTTTAPEPAPTATTATTPATSPAASTASGADASSRGRRAKSGWTIVLDSVPGHERARGALAEARQALHVGLKQVGVLDSAAFSSLHPGYFVVFAGSTTTEAEAQSHVIDAHRHGYREPVSAPNHALAGVYPRSQQGSRTL